MRYNSDALVLPTFHRYAHPSAPRMTRSHAERHRVPGGRGYAAWRTPKARPRDAGPAAGSAITAATRGSPRSSIASSPTRPNTIAWRLRRATPRFGRDPRVRSPRDPATASHHLSRLTSHLTSHHLSRPQQRNRPLGRHAVTPRGPSHCPDVESQSPAVIRLKVRLWARGPELWPRRISRKSAAAARVLALPGTRTCLSESKSGVGNRPR